MARNKIKFSVIIPTYNREKFLVSSLQSARDALPQGGEIIVVNDGAPLSNKTRLEVAKLAGKVIMTSGSLGAGAARNLGATQARGKWLLFLDDDDLIAKNYWRDLQKYIDIKLEIGGNAYGFCKYTSHSDREKMKTLANAETEFLFYPKCCVSIKSKLAGFGVGFWVSKDLFELVDGINPKLQTNEDTDFCLRLLNAGAQCHKCTGTGAIIFSGDHGSTSAQSTTKRHSAKQRASYFKHIIETNAGILATDPKTMHWLWKRYLKMAAKSGGIAGVNNLWLFPKLAKISKFRLALYWIIWSIISIFHHP